MLSNWVMEYMDEGGIEYPFANIRSLLEGADVRFCNLEMPIGTSSEQHRAEKKYTFSLPPRYREAVKYGLFDIVSLANNHMLDYGAPLADSTLAYLQALDIRSVGYGGNRGSASDPVILDRGLRVGFFAYSMTFPIEFWATDSTAGTAYPDMTNFPAKIRAIEPAVDFTVVSFHWGAENSDSTKQYQQDFARRAIDAGADLILGHHPHIWQGLEVYKNRLIAYSLGNLCFGSYSPTALRSGLLEMVIGPDTIYSATIHPLNVKNVEVRFQPRRMKRAAALAFLQDLQRYSTRLDSTGTLRISDQGRILFQ